MCLSLASFSVLLCFGEKVYSPHQHTIHTPTLTLSFYPFFGPTHPHAFTHTHIHPSCPQNAPATPPNSSDQLCFGAGVQGPRGGPGSAHPPSFRGQGLGLGDRCQRDQPVPSQQHTHTQKYIHTESGHALIPSQLLQLLAQSV